MARITVDDCLKKIPNRFELVLVASKRARDLSIGRFDPHVVWGNDRSTVVALREISEGHIDMSYLAQTEEQPQPPQSLPQEDTQA